MSLQGYLFGLKMSTMFAFFAWASVVLYIDPETSGILGKSLFFITLFLWLAGMCTVVLTWLQRKLFDDEYAAGSLGANMRRSSFIAFFVLSLLALQYFKVLAWWSGCLAGGALLLIELYFAHHTVQNEPIQKAKPVSRGRHFRLKQK